MKKTCNGCKASEYHVVYSCRLGHEIDIKNGIPKEQCEKPVTYIELVKLSLR